MSSHSRFDSVIGMSSKGCLLTSLIIGQRWGGAQPRLAYRYNVRSLVTLMTENNPIMSMMSQYLRRIAYGRQIISDTSVIVTPAATEIYRIVKYPAISKPEPRYLILNRNLSLNISP